MVPRFYPDAKGSEDNCGPASNQKEINLLVIYSALAAPPARKSITFFREFLEEISRDKRRLGQNAGQKQDLRFRILPLFSRLRFYPNARSSSVFRMELQSVVPLRTTRIIQLGFGASV